MRILSVAVGCIIALAGFSVGHAGTLEQDMTEKEFERSGLHRLSPEELAYLNEYLGRAAVNEEAIFGAEQLDRDIRPGRSKVDVIQAHIKGSFEGWGGKTIFRLDNGQVWQQRVASRYRLNRSDPAVTIERERFGYYLTVDETGRKVAVKRLK